MPKRIGRGSIVLIGLLATSCAASPPTIEPESLRPTGYQVQQRHGMPDYTGGDSYDRGRGGGDYDRSRRRRRGGGDFAGYSEDRRTCMRYWARCMSEYGDRARCDRIQQACLDRRRPSWWFWQRWLG